MASDECMGAPEATGTIVLRLGYRGTAYSGYAEQRACVTVAGELRRAIETFLRREVELTCAGRTDAGVHALAQHVSFPAYASELAIPQSRWMRAMVALLPSDIAVQAVYHADPGFSARFDARARTYIYRIATGDAPILLTREMCWWHRPALDVSAMEQAARLLEGEHDFKSFCKKASAIDKPTCREVMATGFAYEENLGESCLTFTIKGNAFLHSMVRTIVGTLVEVGMHRKDALWVQDVLHACDRSAAGPTAPACGLTFSAVDYAPGTLRPCPL